MDDEQQPQLGERRLPQTDDSRSKQQKPEAMRGARVATEPSKARTSTGNKGNKSVRNASLLTGDDLLLAYARARHGRYLRDYEDAVADGWAKELMHDPYPPPDLSKSPDEEEEGPQTDANSESTWGWMFGDKKPEAAKHDGHHKRGVKQGKGDVKCEFQDGFDYMGDDLGNAVEGISAQACCELCAKKKGCVVAVMSSSYDNPPRACWMKTRIAKPVQKRGVVACWAGNNRQKFEAHSKAALKDGM